MESTEKHYVKKVGVIFLVILVGLLIFRVVKDGIFSKTLGINVAVVGDDSIAVLILRPDEDVLGWVKLPGKLKIKIYNSSAQYPIGSLWEYGVNEKHPYTVLEKSLGLSMGVPIARTIKIHGDVSPEEVLANLHKINLKTNLSLRDRFLIRQYLVDSVTSKKVLEMVIPASGMDKITEPDGKEFLVFNNVISLWTKNKFLLESILNENVDLSVNNLSGIAGQGIFISRQLEAAGIRVIEVKTDPANDIAGSGCVFVLKGSYPYTESFLTQQMGCVKHSEKLSPGEKGIDLWVK